MLSDDTKVIDYMRVGHRVTQFDIDSLQRIKTALVEGQKPTTNKQSKQCQCVNSCVSTIYVCKDCGGRVNSKR